MKKLILTILISLVLFSCTASKQPKQYKEYNLSEIREKKKEQKESDKWYMISLIVFTSIFLSTKK